MYHAVCPNRTTTLREEWPVKVTGWLFEFVRPLIVVACLGDFLRRRWPKIEDVLSFKGHSFVFAHADRGSVLTAAAVLAAVELQPELVAVVVRHFADSVGYLFAIYVGVDPKASRAGAIKRASWRISVNVRYVFKVAHEELISSCEQLRFSDVAEVKRE